MRRVVVAGGATAGLSAARELRKLGHDGTIQIVDEEPEAPYRRPEVSKGILSGKLDASAIAVRWPEGLGLERLQGVRLCAADLQGRTITGERDGQTLTLPFDGLVIATGSVARPSPFPQLDGVHSLRSLADGLRMGAQLRSARRVVLVGGGFIGLEVAAVARGLDVEATVVEATDLPLGRPLGAALAEHMTTLHREHGVEVLCGLTVTELHGHDGAVEAVSLSDGRRIDADLVLVSIGSAPATDWIADSGADLTDGVRCDRTCALEGVEGVVAAGDVASWYNPLYERRMRVEHWTNAIEQGTYAARRLMGVHDPDGFASAPYFWSDQYGMRLQSIGSAAGFDEIEVVRRDGPTLVVAYGRNGRVVCVAGLHAGTTVSRCRVLVAGGAGMDEVRAAATPAAAS